MMKYCTKYIGLLFLLFLFFVILQLKCFAIETTLRVGLFLNQKEINITSDNGLSVYDIDSQREIANFTKNAKLKITASNSGFTLNGKLLNSINTIRILPSERGFIQVEGNEYRGEIEIINQQNCLNVINIINIEEYLYGVLKKEISPDWPEEALKAQAIAARTFALFNMNKYIDQGYNICATTNSQAYGGLNAEHPSTNKAVNDTRGIIAVYQDEPINAVYHSDSGGHTENSEDVWGGIVPYLRGKKSEYEDIVSPPNHEWDYTLKEEEILVKLQQNGYKINNIREIAINTRTEEGRVISVDIYDNENQKITLKVNDFRLIIGPTLIRSSLFNINTNSINKIPQENIFIDIKEEVQNKSKKTVRDILNERQDFSIAELINLLQTSKEERTIKETVFEEKEEVNETDICELAFTFAGKGNGHGVGLSQWGAYGMAEKGYNYEEILKYYYHDIQLLKKY
ncbi:MAG: SpoIID/LytB domain-containing protein [Atribacterota bacterium]|nr:SpoIID/LytB domain-containing protein [Atribacterota bacterium]